MSKYQISNSSFKDGPLYINDPGAYYFTENIVLKFYKTKEDFFKFHENNNFGFMGGIIIQCSNVTIDMQGYSISQSITDFCLQRFFALIQLNDFPFKNNAGPIVQKRNELIKPQNITIKNGVFGLCSHQAILGNTNKDLNITNVTIEKFEVTAITLNNAENVNISYSTIKNANNNIPLNLMFSSSIFIYRLFQTAAYYFNESDKVSFIENEVNILKTKLDPFINIIFNISKLDELYELTNFQFFINKQKLSPCNIHGIKVTGSGPTVGNFHQSVNDNTILNSNNININKVNICNIVTAVNEELSLGFDNKFVNIGAGTVATFKFIKNNFAFDIIKQMKKILDKYPDVNKYFKSDINKTEIYDCLVSINSGNKINKNISDKFSIIRNCDTMGHINKGTLGIRSGSLTNSSFKNIKIKNIVNYGDVSYDSNKIMEKYGILNETFMDSGFTGLANLIGSYSTGFIMSGVNNSYVSNLTINNILSKNSSSVGIFVNNDSNDINITNCNISSIKSNENFQNSSSLLVDENAKNININNVNFNLNKTDNYIIYYSLLFYVSIILLYLIRKISFSSLLSQIKKLF